MLDVELGEYPDVQRAFVPAFASGKSAPPLPRVFTRVAVAIGGVILLILLARVIVPRLFRRIAALGSREVFTAGVIVLIVATIAAAGRLGISPALGALYSHCLSGETKPLSSLVDATTVLLPQVDSVNRCVIDNVLLNPFPYVDAHRVATPAPEGVVSTTRCRRSSRWTSR